MSDGLKAFSYRLAQDLGLSPDAVYERQRALVRAGLLTAGTGRGPRSGVRVTGRSVALLLLALLASDGIKNRAKRVAELSQAKTTKKCGLTGKTILVDAFEELLVGKSYETILYLTKISVSRSTGEAEIHYRDKNRNLHVTYFASESWYSESSIQVIAQLLAPDIEVIRDNISIVLREVE